jgi:hypothetical protein
MPRLESKIAGKVNETEVGSFKALEPGKYRCRLAEVEAKTARSSGKPMWTWKYETIESPSGRTLWTNTVIDDSSFWKIAETFAAFGVPADTDTDELIGCTVLVTVIQREIGAGSRMGEMGNDIQRVEPDEHDEAIVHDEASFDGESGTTPEKAAAPARKASRGRTREDY